MQLSNLQNRIIFGIIAAVVAGFVIYKGGSTFYLFITLASVGASLEFDRLRKDGKICFIFCAVPILFSYHPQLALALVGVAIFVVMATQRLVKKYFSWLVISIFYISIPAISVIWLRDEAKGFEAVIWLALVVVATDIGGYIFGRAIGKNLLAPSISPKKTWEGLAGGVLAAGAVSYIYTQNINMTLLALVLAVIGQVSDLMESAIKRYFGVKDTGGILPGHGGIMDRTDGFVLTAPLAAIIYNAGWLAW